MTRQNRVRRVRRVQMIKRFKRLTYCGLFPVAMALWPICDMITARNGRNFLLRRPCLEYRSITINRLRNCCLPILLPVLGLVSILIYLKDGRPIFFFQKRIGYRGAVFTVCKFRTMVINSKAGASILDIRDQGFEGALVRHSDMTRKNDARV